MHEYLLHLAEVNEIQPVHAKEDILSEQGTVLAAKGTSIDLATAQLLSQHTFERPIETLIELEGAFTAEIIYALFHEFINNDPVFQALYDASNLDGTFVKCIAAFCQYEVLRQKFNVLAIQLPDIFDQAFFCGWTMVTTLAIENKSQDQLNTAFTTALCHDLGLLNVSPLIMFKPTKLTPKEWQAMQQHPAFGAKLLKDIEGINKACIKAVLEHHEAIDGSGYPSGKVAQQLGELGQLLFLVDSINAIYKKHFKARNRTLHDMLPLIQMSNLTRKSVHADALMSMCLRSPKTEHCAIAEELIPDVITLVKTNAKEITKFILYTSQFSSSVGAKHGELAILTLQNIARMIRETLFSCGLINDAYMRWLDQVGKEKLDFAYRELEDALLMTEEIKFHMQRYQRQIALYLSQPEHSEVHEHVVKLQSQLDSIPHVETTEGGLLAYLQGNIES